MKRSENIPQSDRREDIREEEKKQPFFAGSRGKIISAMLMLVVVAAYMAYTFGGRGGSVSCAMDDQTLGISALSRPTLFIPYASIEEASVTDTVEMSRILSSEDWDSGWCGIYENETFGTFTMCAYSDVGKFIVVRSTDGVVVFNLKSVKQTDAAFETLSEHLA